MRTLQRILIVSCLNHMSNEVVLWMASLNERIFSKILKTGRLTKRKAKEEVVEEDYTDLGNNGQQ